MPAEIDFESLWGSIWGPHAPQNLCSRLSGGLNSTKSSTSLLDTILTPKMEPKASRGEPKGCPKESSDLPLGTSGAPLGATLASRGLLDRIFGPGGRPGRLPDGSRTDFGTQSHKKLRKSHGIPGFATNICAQGAILCISFWRVSLRRADDGQQPTIQ